MSIQASPSPFRLGSSEHVSHFLLSGDSSESGSQELSRRGDGGLRGEGSFRTAVESSSSSICND